MMTADASEPFPPLQVSEVAHTHAGRSKPLDPIRLLTSPLKGISANLILTQSGIHWKICMERLRGGSANCLAIASHWLRHVRSVNASGLTALLSRCCISEVSRHRERGSFKGISPGGNSLCGFEHGFN